MKHITFGGSENMRKRAQHFQVRYDDDKCLYRKCFSPFRSKNVFRIYDRINDFGFLQLLHNSV